MTLPTTSDSPRPLGKKDVYLEVGEEQAVLVLPDARVPLSRDGAMRLARALEAEQKKPQAERKTIDLAEFAEKFTCPRCAFKVVGDAQRFVLLVAEERLGCAYCEENGRRFRAGKGPLRAPSPKFPTATGEGMES